MPERPRLVAVIRGKSKSFAGASFPAILVLATLACSGGAEYLALQKFFEASRLRDRTALRSISTVSFEPMADGTLTTFKITSSRPRSNANRLVRIHQRSVSPS